MRRATDEGTSLTSNLEPEHVEETLRGHLQGRAPRRSALVRIGEPLELLAQDVSRAAKRVGAAEHERGGERRRGSRRVHVHAVAEEHRRGPVRPGVAADGARRGDGRREQRQHRERNTSNGFRHRRSTLTETAGASGVAGVAGTNSSACAGPLRAIRALSQLRRPPAFSDSRGGAMRPRSLVGRARVEPAASAHRTRATPVLKNHPRPREDKVSYRLTAHESRPPGARLAGNDTHRWHRHTRRSRSTRRTPPPVAASPPPLRRAPSRSARNTIGTDGHRRNHPRVAPTSSPAPSRPRSRTPNSAPPHPANGRATASTSTHRARPSSSPTESSRPRSRSTAWTSLTGSRSAR